MLDTRLHRQQPQDIDQEGLRYDGHFFILVGVAGTIMSRVNSIFNNSIFFDLRILRFQVSSLSSPFFSVLNNRFADFSTEFNTYFY